MPELRILFPDLPAVVRIRDYMLSIGEAHLMSHGVKKGYPARVRVPIPTAAKAVEVYPLIRSYCSEPQLQELERYVRASGLGLPIPVLNPGTAKVQDLVGLDRQVRNYLLRADVHTITALIARHTSDLADIPHLGKGKRRQHLIDCVHAHGFVFGDE